MALDQYLLSLRFIRETEADLTAALENPTSALEQYEMLVALLVQLEKLRPTQLDSSGDREQIHEPAKP